MDNIKIIKGFRPLHFVGEQILFSKDFGLYLSDHTCEKFKYIGDVPHTLSKSFKCKLRLISRVFRTGLSPGCILSENRALISEKDRLWQVDLNSGRIDLDHESKNGFKPLSVSVVGGVPGFDQVTCCYGEYGPNPEKRKVCIWGKGLDGEWTIVYTFPEGAIEHIHSIIPDKERNIAWILTGDYGCSPGLWKATDNFTRVEPVLVGQQDYRSAWLFLSGRDVYYATDSQLEKNSFRKLIFENNSVRSDYISSIPGSSIYSCKVGGRLVFSTTVEPGASSGHFWRDMFELKRGPGIESNNVSLLVWDSSTGLQEIATLPKDFLPPRLFQFGTLSFPVGHNPKNDRLYTYATALSKYDNCTIVFDLPMTK